MSDVKVGRSMSEFGDAISVSRSHLYALPEELQPFSVKIGGRRVVVEDPRAFLERLLAAQRAECGK